MGRRSPPFQLRGGCGLVNGALGAIPSAYQCRHMQTPWPCESWDLAIPPVPARSRLYCLAPMGIGTPEVESLTGYIARLAEAHSVTVADLVGAELSDASSVPLLPPRPHPKS